MATADAMDQVVTTWMVSGRAEEVEAAVAEVAQGKLIGVVKALGQYLTSEDDHLRTKGVEFLSTVIVKCPPNALNRQSVKVLSTFFCDKLDDTETIVPALKGLASLPVVCSDDDAALIVEACAIRARPDACPRPIRPVLRVHDYRWAGEAPYGRLLKAMQSEFILGYIALAEGEKDPRNLLVAFTIARAILVEFDAQPHIETLSNILFCYFPITFRPPPNDPYGITPDDLRNSLRLCLNAHPGFAPIAIPIFLEKLAAGSPAIKRDTLQTMTQCIPVYGAAPARENARKLWNSLKLEIFQPTDRLTEEEALTTLRTLVVTIHTNDAHDSDVQGLARDACEECIAILREPEKSQARAAIKVLCAFMATTPSVAKFTLENVVPHLLKLFADPMEVPARPSILLLLSEVIAAARDSVKGKTEAEPPLGPHKDEVLGAFVSGVGTAPTTRPALAGLTGLVATPGLLSEEELGFVVLKVDDILKDCLDDDHSDDRNAILKLLITVSTRSPTPILEQTLPLLLPLLPTLPPTRSDIAARSRYHIILSTLSALSVPAPLFAALIAELYPRLAAIAFPSMATDTDEELSAAFLHSLLLAIRRALGAKVDAGQADDVGEYIDSFVPGLYGLCVRGALQGGPMRDRRIVSVVADIIGLVVQQLEVEKQQSFASKLFPAFLAGQISAICASQHVAAGFRFIPFEADATTSERDLLVLFEAGVAPLHKTVQIDIDTNACLQRILADGLAHAENEAQEGSIVRVVASIVNKHVEELGPFLEDKSTTYWSSNILDGPSVQRRRQAIRVWTWISKALLVRNHPLALQFIHRLFDVFADPDIGTDAAKAFGEIAGKDTVLTKKNGAIVKILWSQKFATGILPTLIDGAKSSPTHLIALTSLIKAVPHTAYAHEMPSLLPLLLRALTLPLQPTDAGIRADVVETLLGAVATSPSLSSKEREKATGAGDADVLTQHASSLASTMLGLARVDPVTASAPRLRIAALRLLAALPQVVRYDVLHPRKAEVLRGLDEALDDPKKGVRREAVDAREVWFKYTG
ncbi:ARM repeat-containing protein [Mycena kentingensis (nom. inval.)]|nr:ARM repeat-containing protein [Mycena kentingensis (nom. inval.)]